jgi:hypothetical protein
LCWPPIATAAPRNPALDRKKAASMSSRWKADDRDHDPHHERDQVVQHPRRGIDALPAPMLAHLEGLATDAP